jgi:cytochrome c biogenesis factor
MLINNINIGDLWAQGVILIFGIIPAAMFLVDKDFSISRLIDLKENKDKFLKRFITCLLLGVGILVVLLLVGVFLMRVLGVESYMAANICLGLMAVLVLTIGIVEKVKFPYKGKVGLRKQTTTVEKKEKRVFEENSMIDRKNIKQDKGVEEVEKKQKPIQEKPIQEKPIQEKPIQEKPIQEKPIQEKPAKKKPAKKKDIDLGNETL